MIIISSLLFISVGSIKKSDDIAHEISILLNIIPNNSSIDEANS